MWKVFIEFVTILLLFYVLVFWPQVMWDLSSRTRDQTRTPCIGRWSLNHWTTREVPIFKYIKCTRKRVFSYYNNNYHIGLPWWCSGWESACQCRGHGFEPWSGKIPHAAEQLGPWATIPEPARLEPLLRNKRRRDNERPAHRDEEWPPLATTRESPRTETKTQHSHK